MIKQKPLTDRKKEVYFSKLIQKRPSDAGNAKFINIVQQLSLKTGKDIQRFIVKHIQF